MQENSERTAVHDRKENGLSLRLSGAFCMGSAAAGIGKLLLGLLSLSLFTCVNALYTFGMVAAKGVALTGIAKEQSPRAQYRYYRASGWILIGASLLYMLYSARLFVHPVNTRFHPYVAIGIAAFTFTELALNLRGVLVTRHRHSPLHHAVKTIHLASSLICLVLTQTALLSFASVQTDKHPFANGLFGVMMGAVAALLGFFMLIRISRIQKGLPYRSDDRKLRRLIREEKLEPELRPVCCRETTGERRTLYVALPEALSEARFAALQRRAEEKWGLLLRDSRDRSPEEKEEML